MNWFIYLFVFLFGLIIGSFINCLIYRLHIKKSFLGGRSFCPKCKHQLSWRDNIPVVSFLLLKGKCGYCSKKISVHYPLVELITGLVFLLVFAVTIGSKLLSCYLVILLLRNWLFAVILIIIFIYDLKYYLILDKITIPAMLIALLFNIIIQLLTINSFSASLFLSSLVPQFLSLLVAALAVGGFFLVQFLISKGKWIGGGDVRLGFLIGLMLGWPQVLVAVVIAYILGSIIGLVLILTKQKTIKSQVPLGSFVSVGTLITLLFGQQILNWYLNFSLW